MDLDRSSIVLYVFRLGMSLSGFLGTIYFVRKYGPGILGVYVLFEGLINVLGLFTRFGVDNAVEKRISEYGPEVGGRYLSSAFLISFVIVLPVTTLCLVFRSAIGSYLGVSVIAVFVLVLAISTVGSISLAVLRAERRIATSAGLEFLGEALRVVSSILLLLHGEGVVSLLYGVLISQAVRTLLTIVLVDVEFELPTRSAISDLVSFSRYSFGAGFGGLLYGWMDTLVLGFFVTKDLVGIYESAWNISVVTMLASQALAVVLFPSVSSWHAEGKIAYIESAYTKGTTYAFVLVIPAFVGSIVLGDHLMTVLYHYQTGFVVLVILVGGKLFQAINQITMRFINGMDKPELSLRVTLAMIIVNTLLNLGLVPIWGMRGAAVATMMTSLTTTVLGIVFLRDLITVRLDWYQIGWQLLGALSMGGVIYVLSSIVVPNTVPKLLGLVGIGAAVYGCTILLNERMRHQLTGAFI